MNICGHPGAGLACVPASVHYSCRRFARNEIAGVLNERRDPREHMPPDNIWLPDPADPAAYDARIAAHGGIGLFILACGAGDGHVAFNPPGSARDSRTRIVTLAEQTRQDNMATFPDFSSLDEVPRHGVTVGVGTIAEHSHAAAMIVWGADKRLAWRRLNAGGRIRAGLAGERDRSMPERHSVWRPRGLRGLIRAA